MVRLLMTVLLATPAIWPLRHGCNTRLLLINESVDVIPEHSIVGAKQVSNGSKDHPSFGILAESAG